MICFANSTDAVFSAQMDKRATADLFRQRLAALLARSGLSQSAFAARIGIDRSALSQLLAGGETRLPRAETLVALSARFGVSVDWLLGLANEPGISAETRDSLEVQPSGGYSDNALIEQWHQEAIGLKIRAVPSRLPALFRTPEVIAFESGGRTEERDRALAQTTYRLNHSRHPESDMENCMPVQTIHEFAVGAGRWYGLPRDQRRAQLRHMADILDELYPSFRLYLYDALAGFLLPQIIFGYQRATIFAGDVYLIIRARQTIRDLTRAFDAQVRTAQVHAHQTADYLRSM